MKIVGIVAEYNPLHNGHIYQIKLIKKMFPESIIIVSMSGNFTERGELSVLDKYTKTLLALQNKVDIVLEVPFAYSNQSADTFSYAALKMLNEFKINTLVFGSESANKDFLYEIANLQINNDKFDSLVKSYISEGNNYPTSLSKAIKDLTGKTIKESNDLLGVSYIKEIIRNNYKIEILPIKRTNDFYKANDTNIISAYKIREYLSENKCVKKYIPNYSENLLKKIPYDKIFTLLKYKIISEKESLYKYHLVTEGIENRIWRSAIKSNNYEELVNSIKNKRITSLRANRILMNILVGFTKEESLKYKSLNYIRLLGLSKEGKKYYNKIKKDINIPIYTKYTKENNEELELKATRIYNLITNTKTNELKEHTITL